MTDFPRLIEFAFPLKQASLDSLHEKNVRHGHISTLHIWPARRPLAACRAALIATLLPDASAEPKPEGMSEAEWQQQIQRRRQELCEKIGGKVVKRIERKKMPGGQVVEREKEETVGGILHWGRETKNAEMLEWFRQEIRKAYGGRAPKVLDPFAGGGAIPLEAMRLGCEATAIDINPVAWFILRCTLEYPQKLAGQTLPLPEFILDNEEFMNAFYKAHPHLIGLGKKTRKQKAQERVALFATPGTQCAPQADLAWHVRAWGQWVLDKARRELARFYPVYADFEPLVKDEKCHERQPMRQVPLKEDGTPDIDALNAQFSKEYLANKRNPQWVAKPTVAYLWARTVTCKNCRATVPLLKTRWLCKKDKKRVLLRIEPNAEKTGVVFGIEANVCVKGGNAAQKREHDKRLGAGTMTRAGAKCPCCGTINTMEDIRLEGRAGRMGTIATAVVVDGPQGKEYRLPTEHELRCAEEAAQHIERVFADVPFGVPTEPTPAGGGTGAGRAFSVQGYGLMRWSDLFTPRQLVALGVLVRTIRRLWSVNEGLGLPDEWKAAILSYLACSLDRLADYNSTICVWGSTRETIAHTFTRFALPITWDFCETNALHDTTGSFIGGLHWVTLFVDHALMAAKSCSKTLTIRKDVVHISCHLEQGFDAIVTDPPYYDAIPYSDLADFFHIWLRRIVFQLQDDFGDAFSSVSGPKWNFAAGDGELIDDPSRFNGDELASKNAYEKGMYHAFCVCLALLRPEGRMLVVFANKQPDAWQTLVSSLIRSGALVDSSWPIVTEMKGGVRNFGRASLASSVWLVCKRRPENARPGWDNKVLEEMRSKIAQRLRDFWDAGIRGPDFVWAATGPALEAYSKHPVVKKADSPGEVMTVAEFLSHVRRMVVDFVVGRVLVQDGDDGALAAADRLDELTAYYLLHRHDFGLEEAPVGACILYATACGLSDQELTRDWDLLVKTGGDEAADEDEDEGESVDEPSEESGSGSKVKLKPWNHRRARSMGYEAPGGRPVPLIDRIHRLMHLWKAGDVHKVDEYLDEHGLRRHELFRRVLQSLIELSKAGSEERSLLESLSNHIGAKGAKKKEQQPSLTFSDEE